MADFLARLKQRKLVQWALAYVAFAFALLQGVDIVAQRFAWPEAVERGLIVALAIGFFVALVLAWYHGERGEQKAKGMELLILAVLFAVGGGMMWRFARVPASAPAAARTAAAPAVEAPAVADSRSIAVLPLINASGDDKQQFFSDGISESLIVALSQVPGLTVIGRNSSFQFRDVKTDSRTVGEKLGVARLLGGSVQHAGDAVRISVELVDAPSGRALWSQRYDRPYTDLFKLQDDITNAVIGALQAKLLGSGVRTAQSDRPPNGSIEAYNAYLQAVFEARKFNAEGFRQAIPLLDRAIALDPGYALAYAKRATVRLNSINMASSLIGAKRIEAARPAREDVQRALALNPDLAYAYGIAGYLADDIDADRAAAEAAYRRALALQPDLSNALNGLSDQLMSAGRYAEAVDLIRHSLLANPLSAPTHSRLAGVLMSTGRWDEAQAAIRKSLEIQPDSWFGRRDATNLAIMRGDAATAAREAEAIAPGPVRDGTLALARQIAPDRAAADAALREFTNAHGADNPSGVAELYAVRGEPGPMFDWMQRALAAGDPGVRGTWGYPFLTRYRDDPRFVAFCKQAGIATPAEADAANAAYLAKPANEAGAR
ncbi:MAG: tetratricopeptide repeat protein [Proteobacteria bacterium]|uniref:tetratricopeptide repeat protein n=1 Tax=Rudaea sp. TaxID=2136325 RepID=UPI0032208BA9|nr:tetratricopeptide repeat protein [Pseudomonadota bacterium]